MGNLLVKKLERKFQLQRIKLSLVLMYILLPHHINETKWIVPLEGNKTFTFTNKIVYTQGNCLCYHYYYESFIYLSSHEARFWMFYMKIITIVVNNFNNNFCTIFLYACVKDTCGTVGIYFSLIWTNWK